MRIRVRPVRLRDDMQGRHVLAQAMGTPLRFRAARSCPMIPPPGHPVWVQLARGRKQVMSRHLAVNLLLDELRQRYRINRTDENAEKLAARAYEFFAKYENLYADEIRQLFFP